MSLAKKPENILLHFKYRNETGNALPIDKEISVIRQRGDWILDCNDKTALEDFGYTGIVIIPDLDYFEWLEEIAKKYFNL